MPTYYMRSDGTAANIAASVGPITDAAACMNEAVFNAATFAAGDTIYISSLGGILDPLTCTPIGTESLPITIQGLDAPLVQRASVGQCLTLNTGTEWVRINDINFENTYAVAGSSTNNDTVRFAGAVGAADDESVILTRCNVLGNPVGDGFSQASSGSGHVRYVECGAYNCGTADASTVGNQGWTAHAAAQSATLVDCIISGCNEAVSFVGGSIISMTGGTITDSRGKAIKIDNAGRGTFTDVTIAYNISTATHLIDNANDSTVIIQDSAVNVTNHYVTAASYLSSGKTYLLNNTISINAAEFTLFVATGGSLRCEANDITLGACDAYAFRYENAGKFDFIGNVVDCSGMVTDRAILLNTATVGNVCGNVFKNFGAAYEPIWVLAGSHNIYNNVFYRGASVGGPTGIVVAATMTPVITNNIFMNMTTSISGGSPVLSYNCYYNASNAGGTGSITTNPLFVDPATGDFRLQCTEDGYAANSPCRDTGTLIWGGSPAPIGYDGEPFQSFKPSMGAWQHQHGAFHPRNL